MITPDMMPAPLFPDQQAANNAGTTKPRKQRRQPADNILLDVLGAILGKRN